MYTSRHKIVCGITCSALCSIPLRVHGFLDKPGEGEVALKLLLCHGHLLPAHHLLIAQLLLCSGASEHPQPELGEGCGLGAGLEEAQVAVTVQEGNYLGKYGDNDIIKFPGKHVLEGATILEAAYVHGFLKHPVGVNVDSLSLPQQAMDVAHQNGIEGVRIWGGGENTHNSHNSSHALHCLICMYVLVDCLQGL